MSSPRPLTPSVRFGFPALIVLATAALVAIPSVSEATDRPFRVHWANKDLTVNPLYEVYVDNVPFDLNGYARARYGVTATAVLTRDHAYGWQIRYRVGNQTRSVGIDMLDVARWQGQMRWGLRVKNYGCYFVNWYGNSWRGTYILRGLR